MALGSGVGLKPHITSTGDAEITSTVRLLDQSPAQVAESKVPAPLRINTLSAGWVRIVGTVVEAILGTLLTFAGALFALVQAQGWRF
jgi:hypothetical protein